jgi:iron only hydrogenase large subunit-like protein
MIGTKKLSTIRQEIEQALASAGEDPIQRLERQIASAKRKGNRTEVVEGLKRFLETSRKRKTRKHRVGARGG